MPSFFHAGCLLTHGGSKLLGKIRLEQNFFKLESQLESLLERFPQLQGGIMVRFSYHKEIYHSYHILYRIMSWIYSCFSNKEIYQEPMAMKSFQITGDLSHRDIQRFAANGAPIAFNESYVFCKSLKTIAGRNRKAKRTRENPPLYRKT